MKNALLTVLILIALSSVAYAHTDPAPVVTINAVPGKEVATAVTIYMFAEDSGFYDGIVSITLREDGKIIATKDCNLPQCWFDFSVEHREKGSHNYAAYVRDRGGNVKSASVFVKFIGATPPPVFVFDERPYAEEGKLLERNVLAEDFNHNGIPNIAVSGLPNGATFINNVLKWIPGFGQAGSYTLTFTAKDIRNQTSSKNMVISVRNVNRMFSASVVDPTQTNFMMNEDSSTRFILNVTDPDTTKPVVEWVLDGRTVSSGSIFLYKTDFDDAGNHLLIARVKDGDFLQRFMWNITVNNVNREPRISDISDRTVKEGANITITVHASDPDSDALSYEATQLPSNAKFDPDTRAFKWYAKEPGTYDISFRVKDIYGYADSTSLQIFVKEESDKDKLHRLYHEALERAEQRRRELRQAESQRTTSNPVTQTQEALRTITSIPTCNPDYLCYTYTYFFI